MRVTIRQLADYCGLSISTVSKALNGYADVNDATREAVRAAAQKIGYRPNSIARALKTNHTFNLGVLFADENNKGLTHPYFSAVLESFKVAAESHGYDITFISHNLQHSSMSYLEHCQYRNVDGVCIACVDFLAPEVNELVLGDLPVVTIDHLFNARTCIQSENRGGIRMLIEHVRAAGHTRIAYIHGMPSSVTQARVSSFHSSMAALGLPLPPEYLVESVYLDPGAAENATEKLLRLKNPPTCILMPDDYAALGAFEAAAKMGLSVPRDLSIVGYDGIRFMQLHQPPITTLKQDTDRIGSLAAEHLIGHIENPLTKAPEIVVVDGEIIPGGTLAPPSR